MGVGGWFDGYVFGGGVEGICCLVVFGVGWGSRTYLGFG